MSVDISLETLWNQVLELLESQLSRPTYEGWIKNVVAGDLTDNRLTILTPSVFAKNWLHKYYVQNITDAVTEIIGYPVEIYIEAAPSHEPAPPELDLKFDAIEVGQDGMLETAIAAEALAAMAAAIPPTVGNAQNNLQSENTGHAPRPSNLNLKYNFNRFVVGSTNRMAHAAALAVSESPGREFNPLLWCGFR
jgi:chromosomal replication initiator protein